MKPYATFIQHTLMAVWVVCSLGVSQSFAQQQSDMQQVLYLHDGSVIRGIIVDRQEGDFVKIETIGQNIFVIGEAEIQRISLEPAVRRYRRVRVKRDITYAEPGYYNLTQFGWLVRSQDPFYSERQSAAVNLQMVNGYRFHRLLHTGVGVGVSFFERGYMLPVFAELRGDLLKLPISPHYYVNGGYSFPLYNGEELFWEESESHIKGGMLAEAGIGIKVNNPGPVSWVFTVGYRVQKSEHSYVDPWSQLSIVESYTHQRLSVQAGIMF